MQSISTVGSPDHDNMIVPKVLGKTADLGKPYKLELVWETIIIFGLLHIGSVYGAYLLPSAKIATIVFTMFLYYVAIVGIAVGAHRLWAHRTFKAKLPLQILLLFMFTTAWMYSAIEWSRNHRVHHKYSDTNADPHNAKRGFFFSHMGWIFCRKHPDVKEKGKNVDMSDLNNDPLLKFHKKYFMLLGPICCVLIPSAIPVYCWHESWRNAFFICYVLRHVVVLNGTCLVNSLAHQYGNKPYDKSIEASQNSFVSLVTLGEGWHNYHHTFPWDYRAAEFGSGYSISNSFIEFFEKIGWAYDLKTASSENIQKRVQRTGDGTYKPL